MSACCSAPLLIEIPEDQGRWQEQVSQDFSSFFESRVTRSDTEGKCMACMQDSRAAEAVASAHGPAGVRCQLLGPDPGFEETASTGPIATFTLYSHRWTVPFLAVS